MNNMINERIESIDISLDWIRKNRPEQFDQRFIQLVTKRRQLKRIADAEDENPAIAAYGESQKGKSYVMSNLLQKNGMPFMIKADGKLYNFIEQINPMVTNVEATGVVTRFSSFSRNPSKYDPQWPVLVKLLSPTDLAAIICDGYFNDVDNYELFSDDDIRTFTADITDRYRSKADVQDVVIEDDILELQDYLKKYIGSKASPYWKSSYFIQVAKIIRKVPLEEIVTVFAPLWHNNDDLTALYLRLFNSLSKLSFADEVRVSIDAVLNNRNTIMSVDCLKGLKKEVADNDMRVVRIKLNDRVIDGFLKCELSALCQETVYKIEDEYLYSESAYCMDMVSPDVAPRVSKGIVKKDILAQNDLLDFPGARPRKSLMAENIADEIDQILLRGKVAFLFNKYCEDFKINVLLYCHDHQNVGFSKMYIILNSWINEYVGSNEKKRKEKISSTGVSPLFIIATKFNIDMAVKSNSAANKEDVLYKRWEDRFNKIMYKECLGGDSVTWFNNWTESGETFKNTYLLRDFKYSGCTGEGNGLYSGYSNTSGKEEKCLIKAAEIDGQPVDFYNQLRDSFVSSPVVRKFFSDPAKSWDLSASINNDGALYIIEQLTVVASNMCKARSLQFAEKQEEVMQEVYAIMSDFYVPEDSGAVLEDNLRKAKAVARELDFTCNADNYYFGHLIKALQITEKDVYIMLHTLIQGSELNSKVNNYNNYELIRKSCGARLDECKSEAEKWNVLIDTYSFSSVSEAKSYLESKDVDYVSLFTLEYKKKINSVFISDAVMELWKEQLCSPEFMASVSGDGSFSNVVMSNLVENIIDTATELKLADRIESMISEYVNVFNIQTVDMTFIADMMASEINNFVIDLGYKYREKEQVDNIRMMASERSLHMFEYLGSERKSDYDEVELTSLFKSLNDSKDAVAPSVEYNYFNWKECVMLSFVSNSSISSMTAEERIANQHLKDILDTLN